jgi:hypothetical protein
MTAVPMSFGPGGDGMRLKISDALRADGTDIEPGTYDVAVDEEASAIVLSRDGAEPVRVQALSRASKAKVRRPSVRLRETDDEHRRLLVARTPPADEWVVALYTRA